jgi:F-type H+-transporting ATPase subunit b
MKKRVIAAGAFALMLGGSYAWAQHQEHETPPVHPTEHGGAAAGAHGEEHGTHDEHGAAPGGAHHGPEPINWTDLSDVKRPAYIGLLVNFGILVALYYTLGKKPIVQGLKQRRANIGKAIEEAQAMLAEAKERAKKYQADLKDADTHAETAKNALVVAGRREAERLLSETEERAERMTRDAERLVEQERKQLQQDLLVETVNLAVTQAQKLLESSTSPEDHVRLANELLAELAKKPAAPRVVARSGGAA